MRIVFFDDRNDQVYGAQKNLLLLAELSRNAGHDPHVCTTFEGAFAQRSRERGLATEIVPAPQSLRRFEGTSFIGGIASLPRIAYDLLSYNVALSRVIRRLDVDVIVVSAVRPAALMLVTRVVGRSPMVLYAQNSIPRGALAVVAGLFSRRICLIGDGARTTFPAWFLRLFRSRFTDLPSGRDLAAYAGASTRSKRTGATPVEIVTVSSVTERKGIHVLIDALASVERRGRSVRLTVVGGTTGPVSEDYAARLVEQADRLDVQVEFVGWQDDVLAFLDAADVFAMASENEGLPGVLIEAMANGLPCVTTRAGSAGELVEAAGAGHAAAIDDVAGLADGLFALCDDLEHRVECGRSGRAHALAHYSLDAYLQRFESILADIVDERNR